MTDPMQTDLVQIEDTQGAVIQADSIQAENEQVEPAQTVEEINLKHYIAFLSHRSTDHEFAEMLLKKLEHYRIGNKIRSDYGIERKYIKPVCIDSNEFASKDLQKEMRTKLDNSAWMVLLCSKASAAHYSEQLNWDADPSVIADWTLDDWMENPEMSGFVGYEIAYMLKQGRRDQILLVVMDGDPAVGDCFHPLVRDWVKKDDIFRDLRGWNKADKTVKEGKKSFKDKRALSANTRKDFLRLVASLLGISNFSEIFDHDAKRKRLIRAGVAVLAALVVAAGAWAWSYFLPHEKHFSDYVMVNGIPQGVGELSQSEYSSTSDHYVISTTRAAHRITLSHVNSRLTPVEEAVGSRVDEPMVAVYQCRSNWNPDTVEFQDRNGVPQITYAYTTDLQYVSFQENEYTSEQVYPTTQTDDYGVPIRMKIDRYDLTFDDAGHMTRRMYMSGVNYAIDETGVAGESYTYDEAGHVSSMRYLNSDREVAANQNGVAGTDYEYDFNGRLVRETLVDANGKAVYGPDWYAVTAYEYSARGDLVTATYYSPEGEEAVSSSGYNKAQRTYDSNGNMVAEEFTGPEGEPLYCEDGYHRGEYAYDGKGDRISAAYFNHENAPTLHDEGYSRIEWDRDANGNATETRYFSTEGTPLPSQTYAAVINRTFNSAGILEEETNYGVNGQPIITSEGYFKKTVKSDAKGRPTEIAVYGIDGQPVYHEEKYHKMAFSYDDRGNLGEITLYGTSDQLIPFNGYWAKQKRTYNGGGQVTSTSYEDQFGNPVMVAGTYARLENTYDDRGLLTSTSYYDTSGKLCTGMNMTTGGFYAGNRYYAAVQFAYDEAGNMVTTTQLDVDGEPLKDGRIAAIEYEHDEVGRNTKISLLQDDGTLVEDYNVINTYQYDQYGRVTRAEYFDRNGVPTNNLSGNCAVENWVRDFRGNTVEYQAITADGTQVREHFKAEYDERGLDVRRDFYDVNGNHTMTENGYASLVVEYNEAGDRVKTTALDTAGNPVVHSEGFAIATRSYDELGNLVGMDYYDADGNPVDLPAGYQGYHYTLNDFRNVTEAKWYDKDGATVVHYTCAYKDYVLRTYEQVFGKNDEPIGSRGLLIARVVSGYDENNQQTSAYYYDVDGNLRELAGMFAGWSSTYEHGQEASRTYYGKDGNPKMQSGGFASATFERNAQGQEIRRRYFGASGEPVNTIWGFAVMEVTYNDKGEIETAAYYDVDGRPVTPPGSAKIVDIALSSDYKSDTIRDPKTGEAVEIAYQIDPYDVRMLGFEDDAGENDILMQPRYFLVADGTSMGDYAYMSFMSYIPKIDAEMQAADLSKEGEAEGWRQVIDDFVEVLQSGDAGDLMALMDLSAVEGAGEMLNSVVNEPKTTDELLDYYKALYQDALDDMRVDFAEKYGEGYKIDYEILDVEAYSPEEIAPIGDELKRYVPESKRDTFSLDDFVRLTVRFTVSGSKGNGMETEGYLTPAVALFKVSGKWTLGAGNGFPKASQDELVEFYGGYKKS